VLREGVFAAYFHSKEHVRIVEVLARQTALILKAMGLSAVKHLKDLIPMFSATMTDPFVMSYPPTLAATILALQETLSSCWPRISNTPWQEEILKILVVCWLNVREDQKESSDIDAALVKTASVLFAVMEAGKVDVSARVGPLLAKEPGLRAMFGTNVSE